jgi:hypothetical protein
MMMTAEMTPAIPAAAPVPLAARICLIRVAAVQRAISTLAARHAAAREAAAVAALDDHMRDDIGLPRRAPEPRRTAFWLV